MRVTIDDPDLVETKIVPESGQIYLGEFRGDKIRVAVEVIERGVDEYDEQATDGSPVVDDQSLVVDTPDEQESAGDDDSASE